MLQKVLKFAIYAVAVLVKKIMLFCSNYAKNYASTIRQGQGTNAGRAPLDRALASGNGHC